MSIVWSLPLALIMVCQLEYSISASPRPIETIVSYRKANISNSGGLERKNLITVSPIDVLIRPTKQKTADIQKNGINFDNLITVKQNDNDNSFFKFWPYKCSLGSTQMPQNHRYLTPKQSGYINRD